MLIMWGSRREVEAHATRTSFQASNPMLLIRACTNLQNRGQISKMVNYERRWVQWKREEHVMFIQALDEPIYSVLHLPQCHKALPS